MYVNKKYVSEALNELLDLSVDKDTFNKLKPIADKLTAIVDNTADLFEFFTCYKDKILEIRTENAKFNNKYHLFDYDDMIELQYNSVVLTICKPFVLDKDNNTYIIKDAYDSVFKIELKK